MMRFILSFLLLLGCSPAFALLEIGMQNFTMQEGLADNTVLSISKDKQGFIWFGTNNGLSVYTGSDSKTYYHPFKNLVISKLAAQNDRYIWMIGNKRLLCFDKKEERFFFPSFENTTEEIKVADFHIVNDTTICLQQEGELLTCKFKENESAMSLQIHYKTDKSIHYITHHCFDTNGTCFALTNEGALLSLNLANGEFISEQSISSLEYLPVGGMRWINDELWFYGLLYGVYVYSLDTQEGTSYRYSSDKSNRSQLAHTDVYDLTSLADNKVIAVGWNGYTVFTPANSGRGYTTEVFDNTYSYVHRTIETHMISVFYDTKGILWIGTEGGGIYSVDLRKQFYKKYMQDRHNEITSICSDTLGHIYLGTFHKGLLRSKAPLDSIHPLDFEVLPIPNVNHTVLDLTTDGNTVWIVGKQPYLHSYCSITDEIKTFPIITDQGKWNNQINSVYKQNDSTLWLGSYNALFKFNIQKNKFEKFTMDCGLIRSIKQDNSQSLWLGGSVGIVRFNPVTGAVDNNFEVDNGLPINAVRSLLLTDTEAYVGYSDGLAVYSFEESKVVHFFTTENGLNNNFIGCLTQDNKGDVWLGTNSAITRYDRKNRIFYDYYISGSNRSAYNYNGVLLWGNNLNLSYFNSTNLESTYKQQSKVYITDLLLDEVPIRVGEKVNGQTVLNHAIIFKDNIKLQPKNNSFSLSFSNLNYNQNQRYMYRLYPLSKTWSIVEEGEKVSVNNLAKGTYVFEVKSVYELNEETPITQLRIDILPKWYETWWFRLALMLLLLLCIVVIIRRLRAKRHRLIEEQKLKQELLLASIAKEREIKINQEREAFFTHIAHELRTPLTLIKGPIESILSKEELSPHLKDKLVEVVKNTKSLSRMVDKLLYMRKIETGFESYNFEKVDSIELLTQVYESFKPLAEIHNIDWKFKTELSTQPLWVDRPKITSVLQNVISNAFKYTKVQGYILMQADLIARGEIDYFRITIEDNGIGMDGDLQQNLFKPYVTGNANPEHSSSMGLGLQIVKSLVESHHGTILIDSEVSKGTRITLLFPLGNEHLPQDDLAPMLTNDTSDTDSHTVVEFDAAAKQEHSILIIEDNTEVRNYIAELFATQYDIFEASNGLEGLEKAKTSRPDLIICDIMMPVMDGFEVLSQLKSLKETADIPIVMLTAKGESNDILLSTQLGAEDFIKKPFNPNILQAKVENLIAMRTRLKQIYKKSLLLTSTDETDDPIEQFMQEIINTIEANLTNPKLSVKMLAEEMNMSQSTLYRRLKEYSDLSAKEIIRNVRVSKAASLIIQQKYQIQEVADKVGYNDIDTFRKHFINEFGIQPSLYKEL